MAKTGRTDIYADNAGVRVAERILCGLPRSAPGDEDVEIRAIGFLRPEQMVLGETPIFVLPRVTSTVQIGDGGRIGVSGVELAHPVGANLRYGGGRLAAASIRG